MSPSLQTGQRTVPVTEAEAVAVGYYANRAEARERSTVLLAKGIIHWTIETSEGVEVRVPPNMVPQALEQLTAYEAEEEAAAAEPPPLEIPVCTKPPWRGLLTMNGLLALVHYYKTHGHDWIDKAWARNGRALFEEGEFWRPLTALFVHADLAHLLGNLFFGSLFMYFVHRAYGPMWAWLSVMLAGAVGNALVAALFYPEPFAGIGASTAVFAAVGLLVAHGLIWTRWSRQLRGHRAWLVPLGGGLALLGLFGSGGENADIDVAAHLFGFVSGALIGWPLVWWQKQRVRHARLRSIDTA